MVTVSAVERAVPSVGVADGNAMEPPMESQMGRAGWENGARKVDDDDGGGVFCWRLRESSKRAGAKIWRAARVGWD